MKSTDHKLHVTPACRIQLLTFSVSSCCFDFLPGNLTRSFLLSAAATIYVVVAVYALETKIAVLATIKVRQWGNNAHRHR